MYRETSRFVNIEREVERPAKDEDLCGCSDLSRAVVPRSGTDSQFEEDKIEYTLDPLRLFRRACSALLVPLLLDQLCLFRRACCRIAFFCAVPSPLCPMLF